MFLSVVQPVEVDGTRDHPRHLALSYLRHGGGEGGGDKMTPSPKNRARMM